MKKLLCLILCALMLPINITVQAAENDVAMGNAGISIPVVIKENNGITAPETLYRRGFALPQGSCYDLNNFGVYDISGNKVDSSFEITEKYKDGSVKWALCSFVLSLRPNERKELTISDKGATAPSKPVTVTKTSKGYSISNQYINSEITDEGIRSVTYNGVGFTDNITTYITLNGQNESTLTITGVSVLTQTPLYARVKIDGNFGDTASTELVLTLAAGAKNVEIESRVTAFKQLDVYSMGLKMTSSDTTFSYPGTLNNNISNADYIYSTKNGVTAHFVSADIEKFKGATSGASTTGFIFDTNTICIAPVIGSRSFVWHDGLTRTNHLTITFDENGNEYIRTLKNPPAITIDPKSFEDAGTIALAGSCAPIDRVLNLVYHELDKRYGKIDAGAIHYGNDPDTQSFSSNDAHPGEMEHNFGIAYMATADSAVYRVMNESAEFWADVEVYKGGLEGVYGANRYRTDSAYNGDRFKTTHPYYGDSSGLYMAYVLTGNEYYRDSYKAAVEHMYSNMYETSGKNCGFNYPHMKNWISGTVQTVTYSESRYMIQARPLYYAYGLFNDEKFREAALEITRWAAHTQNEGGWWYQAYHDDGRPFRQGGQTQDAVKTYIWMYGLRGISFLSRYEDTPEIRLVLSRAGKFVENEYQNYGKGLWKPTGDVNLYECDEDNTRSKGPYEDIMALELLYRAYRLTGDESYFRSILDCTETWLSSMNPGGATMLLANMQGKGSTAVMGGGQNYTLLQIFPELRALFKEKENRIRELGYDYLLTVFDDNAKMYEGNVEKVDIVEPELTQIIFENGDDKVLFGTNFTGALTGNYTKDYETKIPEGYLWAGMENKITTPGKVTLCKHLNQFDRMLARQLPISVTSLSHEVKIIIDEYTENKIVLRAYGDGILNLRVDDGLFPIVKGKRYSVTAKRDGINGAVITICKSCISNLSVADEALEFKVTLSSSHYIKDTESISAYSAVSAGLMSVNNVNNFEPDSAADLDEFSNNVAALTGTDKKFNGTTYEDAASYALEVLNTVNPEFFNDSGIVKKSFTAVGTDMSDKDAVKVGAEVIEVKDYLPVGAIVELPLKSICGTTVEWKSDSNAVSLEDGAMNIVSETDVPVTLTATVKRGNESIERAFTIKVKKSSDVDWYSNTQMVAENGHNLKEMTGEFEINFDITPKNNGTNAIAGFTNSGTFASAFKDIPVIFRLSPNGNIDAYDGSAYNAVENLDYEGGKKYSVKLKISLNDKKFDMFVTPEGGREFIIAKDFKFRETAPSIDSIDIVYIPTATAGTELFHITYMDCASAIQDTEKHSLEMYDENGFMFGRFAENNVYLPEYTDSKKIVWITTNSDIVANDGTITLKNGISDAVVYGIEDGGSSATTLDILKALSLIELTDNPKSPLTRQQAAEIINAIRYVIISE